MFSNWVGCIGSEIRRGCNMTRKCVILSFGFDLSGVLRSYSHFSLKTGDMFVLVIPKPPNPRNESAVKDVEGFISGLKSKGVNIDLEVLSVDASDVESIVKNIGTLINQGGYEYHLEATGGVRSVCVALTILGILFKPKISSFRTINEANGHISQVNLPVSDHDFPRTKMMILSYLKERGSATTKQISEKLGKDISTINRHLSELEKRYLAEKDSSYDAKYSLTYVGEILIMEHGV